MPSDQSAEVTRVCTLEIFAFLVGERVGFHDGYRLPVLQNRLWSGQVKAICGQCQRGAKLSLKLRAPLRRVSEQCRPDRWTRSLNRPWHVIGGIGHTLPVLMAAHSQVNDGRATSDTIVRRPEGRRC